MKSKFTISRNITFFCGSTSVVFTGKGHKISSFLGLPSVACTKKSGKKSDFRSVDLLLDTISRKLALILDLLSIVFTEKVVLGRSIKNRP